MPSTPGGRDDAARRGDATPAADVNRRPLTFLETLYAVLAALLGVRGRAGFERDMSRGSPGNFLLVGIVLVALGAAILWVLVHLLLMYLIAREGL